MTSGNPTDITAPSSDDHYKELKGFNDTITPYSAHKTLNGLFEEQVLRQPAAIAIRYKDKAVSYLELNERANQLAHHLISQGIHPGENVGLLVKRTPEMITGMLAILKAGGAYVPVDPAYPAERQSYIIRQSSVKTVICNTGTTLPDILRECTFTDIGSLDLINYPTEDLHLNIDSKQLAYTIYTSGSTGVPKGVMIAHHSAVNLVEWVNNTYHVNTQDRLLFITSMCFDLSVYDIFGILSCGGSIVIADHDEVPDLGQLAEMMLTQKITFWDSVPTTMDYLIRRLENNDPTYVQQELRLVFLSGDWIPVNLPARIKKFFPNAQVVSLGGATEATVWSNYFDIDKTDPAWKSIPYGRPIYNNFFYILNDDLQPVSHGEQGELYIGGVGVARGYAGDAEKTAYSFIKDPFNQGCGGMMYRTGDLGRMMPDGNMEFMGRKDNQVKIRGFRVELGEIEQVILQHKPVQDAVVVAQDKDGLKQLAGYIVPTPRYDREAMIAYLKRKLPEYMVPHLWMEIGQLPLTANNKIDRKALPEIDITQQTGRNYVAPRNETEKKLAELWQQTLNADKVSIDDNFFDLGGQSLLAVQMLTGAGKLCNRILPINTIFKYSTIRELAEQLDSKTKTTEKYESLVAVKADGNKMPVYLVHGDGMNITNFTNIAAHVDKEQPIYALQPRGLDGKAETFDKMEAIAAHYIREVLLHNPAGPYAFAGYSFGGYVAIEMKRQLEAMGKTVKFTGIFDTDAGNLQYNKRWTSVLHKRVLRQFPKMIFIARSLLQNPRETIDYQMTLLQKKRTQKLMRRGKIQEPQLTGVAHTLNKIDKNHRIAFYNYELQPFHGILHLFKARKRIYFVDDPKQLGWAAYALDGVRVHDVPGDHKTMFLPPYDRELAQQLQQALDKS